MVPVLNYMRHARLCLSALLSEGNQPSSFSLVSPRTTIKTKNSPSPSPPLPLRISHHLTPTNSSSSSCLATSAPSLPPSLPLTKTYLNAFLPPQSQYERCRPYIIIARTPRDHGCKAGPKPRLLLYGQVSGGRDGIHRGVCRGRLQVYAWDWGIGDHATIGRYLSICFVALSCKRYSVL